MKPRIAQGTRDFGHAQLTKRNYIITCIKKYFELFGYKALETPAFENLETLMGKYGMEGDKLIFKILNNGLHEKQDEKKKEVEESWSNYLSTGNLSDKITERALRYDLTIPFARYVSMNRAELSFPFKRYQIQSVWRADRPQKGRYREFMQCDADVIGSQSLVYDGELLSVYDLVFEELGVSQVTICVNNRKILLALAQKFNIQNRFTSFTVIIDKIDKIGLEKVSEELMALGMTKDNLEHFIKIISAKEDNKSQLKNLQHFFQDSEEGMTGVQELANAIEYAENLRGRKFHSALKIDLSLSRGLDYYTGLIVEVKTSAVASGSIGGGGRYDNLTGAFGFPGMSGVGISFGLDRIYNVIEELDLFPKEIDNASPLLIYISPSLIDSTMLEWVAKWRFQGISFDLIVDQMKIDKVYLLAEKRMINAVCIIDDDSKNTMTLKIKNTKSGQITQVHFTQFTINNLSN